MNISRHCANASDMAVKCNEPKLRQHFTESNKREGKHKEKALDQKDKKSVIFVAC